MTTLNKSLFCSNSWEDLSISDLNKLTDTLAVSIFPGRRGFTEYGLRFYSVNGDTYKRLSQARKEYKVLDVYEDCEIGSVDVEIEGVHYHFAFGHDGDEEFTADVETIN